MNADAPVAAGASEGLAPDPAPAPAPTAPPVPNLATPIDVAALQAMPIFPEPTCWSMVAHLYMNVLHIDPTAVSTVTEGARRAARTFQLALHKESYGMRKVEQPSDWTIVLMWPGSKERRPHCGVFWKGKVLHADENGVLNQDLTSLRAAYPKMEYWSP